LLGLFGTVVGMIEIFFSYRKHLAARRQKRLPQLARGVLNLALCQRRLRPGGCHSRSDFLALLPRAGGRFVLAVGV